MADKLRAFTWERMGCRAGGAEETGMLSAPFRMNLTRYAMLALFIGVLGFFITSLAIFSLGTNFSTEGTQDLRGQWEFFNGKLEVSEADRVPFQTSVEVPKQLPPAIQADLKDEYWYRLRFPLDKRLMGASLSLTLGSVKGMNQVFFNGHYIGGGGPVGTNLFKILPSYIRDGLNVVTVRVQKYDSPFLGIVHFHQVAIGEDRVIRWNVKKAEFIQTGKILVLSLFKILFFALFASMSIAMPQKREYSLFAAYSLFSGLAVLMVCGWMPFYPDYYLRNILTALARILAFCIIPVLAVQYARMKKKYMNIAWSYSALIGLSLTISIAKADKKNLLDILTAINAWLPLVAIIPFSILVALQIRNVDRRFYARRIQLSIFAISLFIGGVSWRFGLSGYYTYSYLEFGDLLDISIFLAMACTLILDFKNEYDRSKNHLDQLALSLQQEKADKDKANALAIFAKQLAHDIRSPLAALDIVMIGGAQLPAEQRVLVRNAAKRINEIAGALLHGKSGFNGVSGQPILIARVIGEIVAEKKMEFAAKTTLNFVESYAQVEALCIESNKGFELARIISNVINNAVEAMNKGVIKVSLSSRGNNFLVEIEDNGKGIPPEVLPKIGVLGFSFEKTNDRSGFGIGLHHARTTLERWGGSLRISSEVGRGTKVQLEAPGFTSHETETVISNSSSIHPPKPTSAVLLDDDLALQQVWKIWAKRKNVDLRCFHSPDQMTQALDTIPKETPLYIDSNLGAEEIAGEAFARILYERGYSNIFISTGYNPDSFPPLPWVKAIVGKQAPWI